MTVRYLFSRDFQRWTAFLNHLRSLPCVRVCRDPLPPHSPSSHSFAALRFFAFGRSSVPFLIMLEVSFTLPSSPFGFLFCFFCLRSNDPFPLLSLSHPLCTVLSLKFQFIFEQFSLRAFRFATLAAFSLSPLFCCCCLCSASSSALCHFVPLSPLTQPRRPLHVFAHLLFCLSVCLPRGGTPFREGTATLRNTLPLPLSIDSVRLVCRWRWGAASPPIRGSFCHTLARCLAGRPAPNEMPRHHHSLSTTFIPPTLDYFLLVHQIADIVIIASP